MGCRTETAKVSTTENRILVRPIIERRGNLGDCCGRNDRTEIFEGIKGNETGRWVAADIEREIWGDGWFGNGC